MAHTRRLACRSACHGPRPGVTAVIHRRPGSDRADVPAARDRLCPLADEDLMALVAATDPHAPAGIYHPPRAAGYSLAHRLVRRPAPAAAGCHGAVMAR